MDLGVKAMRDALRNTERWKGRRAPTQDPGTSGWVPVGAPATPQAEHEHEQQEQQGQLACRQCAHEVRMYVCA